MRTLAEDSDLYAEECEIQRRVTGLENVIGHVLTIEQMEGLRQDSLLTVAIVEMFLKAADRSVTVRADNPDFDNGYNTPITVFGRYLNDECLDRIDKLRAMCLNLEHNDRANASPSK